MSYDMFLIFFSILSFGELNLSNCIFSMCFICLKKKLIEFMVLLFLL